MPTAPGFREAGRCAIGDIDVVEGMAYVQSPKLQSALPLKLLLQLHAASLPASPAQSPTYLDSRLHVSNIEYTGIPASFNRTYVSSPDRAHSIDKAHISIRHFLASCNTNLPSSDGEAGSSCRSLMITSEDFGSDCASQDAPAELQATTYLKLRNLPEGCTRSLLEQVLNSQGFMGHYDFLYLPAELTTGDTFGYGFINLASVQLACDFKRHFHGFAQWPMPCSSGCEVAHVEEHTSNAHIELYRNSPFMHASVADELRPATYRGGVRVPFPRPTMSIKAPRIRDTQIRPPPGLGGAGH